MPIIYLQSFECLSNWKGATVAAEIYSKPPEQIVSAVNWKLAAEPIYTN